MSENNNLEERLLRFAAPTLHKHMIDTFSDYNIHPYDVHGTVVKGKDGYEVNLRFSINFSQKVTTHVSFEQAESPDEEVTQFFIDTAEKCKSVLITDYYKMIKP